MSTKNSLPGYDHTTDANPVALHFAESARPLPDYAKGENLSTEKLASYMTGAFADQKNRLFPLTNAGHTLCSGIYALGLPDSPEKEAVLSAVEKTAAVWGIAEDWQAYKDIFQSAVKVASSGEAYPQYALSVDEEHYYPLDGPQEIQKSAALLETHAAEGRLPAGWITDAAREIVKAAACHGMQASELPDFVVRVGTERELDFERAESLLFTRKLACDAQGADFTLYEDIVKAAAEEPENIEQHLQMLEELDLANGIKYGAHNPLPSEILYSGLTKEEFDKFAHTQVIIAGVMVPQQVVGAVKEAAVRQWWAKEPAEKILTVVKAAVDHARSTEANAAAGALDEATAAEFLKFLAERH